jgi:hypothetical protein
MSQMSAVMSRNCAMAARVDAKAALENSRRLPTGRGADSTMIPLSSRDHKRPASNRATVAWLETRRNGNRECSRRFSAAATDHVAFARDRMRSLRIHREQRRQRLSTLPRHVEWPPRAGRGRRA